MDTVGEIRQRAKLRQRTIVLPEYNDKRVVEAGKIIEREQIARVILLSPEKIEPQKKERYIQEYYELRKAKGMELSEVKQLFEDTLYYAAMLTRSGEVDGFVAGASHPTPDIARAAIHCLGIDKRISVACSCFIMVVPDCIYGERGTFVFADCGIIPEPNGRQLAAISVACAELAQQILGLPPRVALLSYSTKGSAKARSGEKITEALGIIKGMAPDLIVDGELQVDAAIVPEVAQIKYPESIVAGRANVLIFPNLEAGNIGYKLVQRLAKARALGPLLVGMNKPASDLSRGCSPEDVVDCVALTSLRAA